MEHLRHYSVLAMTLAMFIAMMALLTLEGWHPKYDFWFLMTSGYLVVPWLLGIPAKWLLVVCSVVFCAGFYMRFQKAATDCRR
jgi:hypothetical protein